MINGIKIEQGYYNGLTGAITRKNGHNIPIAVKLAEFLASKYIKYARQNKTKKVFVLDFTHGIDPENHIEALSVCHPSDQFSRNDGLKRVINRIHQLRVNSENFDWKKYPWIYKLEQ